MILLHIGILKMEAPVLILGSVRQGGELRESGIDCRGESIQCVVREKFGRRQGGRCLSHIRGEVVGPTPLRKKEPEKNCLQKQSGIAESLHQTKDWENGKKSPK
jgi:hypothetical protein